ncbi:MAG: hypothetical protein HZC48_11825 [Nitrospirae bacterium]|nr:hypothetical protein [Nitrospirota bacterium]
MNSQILLRVDKDTKKGLWKKIGSSLKNKGYKVSDVEKTIRKVRSSKETGTYRKD